jgi:hypothetical protein
LKVLLKPKIYLALVHYPVVNKNGETIASAVTNLDLHDIARAAKTYDVETFYVVTPLADQKELVGKIVSHWTRGPGSVYNGSRKAALDLICIQDSLEAVKSHIAGRGEGYPKVVATSASGWGHCIGYGQLKEMLNTGEPCVLAFGTAWGLADQVLLSANYILEPIAGKDGYNHLSVRCAAAIILDRLLGTD